MGRTALGRAVVLALVVIGDPTHGMRVAHADEPSPDRLKSAADEYDRGRRAFLANDFDGAGVHFENAYRDAPRAETLRLAIRARRSAKQLARAATLAAIANDRYANDPATTQLAKETLDATTPELQEYVIVCTAECAIAADGRVISDTDAYKHRLFLEPGGHEIGVSFKRSLAVSKHVDAKRGATDLLAFTPPPEPRAPTAVPVAPPDVVMPLPSTKPFGPAVFFVAAGVTVALGGITIASAIDTRNNPGVDAVRAACAGKDASCPEYQDGRSAQTRTNVLLGATIGAAALTAVTGLFLTQWSRSAVKVGVAPLPGGGAVASAAARF